MELIVKIGADQQGLQQTITRIKSQFGNMNGSMPASWAAPGGPFAPASDSGLAEATGTALRKKGVSMLKGMLLAELSSMAVAALDIVGTKFWEKVYGADEETNARILAAHKKMKASMQGLLQSRQELGEQVEQSRLGRMSPEQRRDFFQGRDVENRAAVRKAQKEFDEAQATLNAAISGEGVTGLNGERLSPQQRRQLAIDLAAAEERLNKARTNQLRNQDKLMAANDEVLKSELEKRDKKKEAKAVDGPGGRVGFEADDLARAGLFAGSSLLFNPAMNVEQQQLDVLRRIEANTDRNSIFAP